MADFNLAALRTGIVRMLSSPDPVVLAIKGGWGEGKTYFWRTQIAPLLKSPAAIYVSLFSIETVQQLRERLLVELIPTTDRVSQSKLWNWSKNALAALPGVASKFGVPSHLVSGLIEAGVLKQGLVVCLDDLERFATAKKDNLGALLGYINELRDRFRLKIVLIYNSDEIKAEVFRDFHEKVIDRDYAFAPTFDEIFEAAFPSGDETLLSTARRAEMKEHCASLPIRNIRILVRLRSYLQELLAVAENPSPFIVRQIGISTSIFVWAKYSKDASEKQITLDFFQSFKGPAFDESASDEKGRFLYSHNYANTDDLDLIILQFIRSDVLDEPRLSATMTRQDELESARVGLEGVHNVWARYFHGTLRDTTREFCEQLSRAVEAILSTIPANTLDESLNILCALGAADVAARIFDEALRAGRQFSEDEFLMSRPRYAPMGRFVERRRQEDETDNRTIAEVMQSAISDEFVQARDRAALARFSTEDLVQYYSNAEFDHLTGSMRQLAKLARTQGISDDERAVGTKVIEAARLLAQRSPINELRMRAMGLLPERERGQH